MTVLAVFGATSDLGRSIVKHLSSDYSIRAVVEDTTSASCHDLVTTGQSLNLVKGNANDSRTLDDALDGAHACFVITSPSFNEPGCQSEVMQGVAIADACVRAGVGHVIYCTNMSVVKIMGMRARHVDAKAEVEKHMKTTGLHLTFLQVPILYDSFMRLPLRPQKVQHNVYTIDLPLGLAGIDMIAADDVAVLVKQVLRNRDFYRDKTLSVSGDKLTIKDMTDVLNKRLNGKCFKHGHVTVDQYRRKHFTGAEDLANMFDFLCRVDQRYNIDSTRKLNPSLQTFDQWTYNHQDELTKALDYPLPQPDPWGCL